MAYIEAVGANAALRKQAEVQGSRLIDLRQATQREKHIEVSNLSKANEEHRQKVSEEMRLGREQLDEMKRVREQVHLKLRGAKAKGFHDTAVAQCALARAGQQALSARGESELWRNHAANTERHLAASMAREQEALVAAQNGADARLATARTHADARLETSRQLNELATYHRSNVAEQHLNQVKSFESQMARHANLKVGAVNRAQQAMQDEFRQVQVKAGKHQMATLDDLQRNMKAGSARISLAQRALEASEADAEAAFERERVCAAQVQRIVAELKEKAKDDLAAGVQQLDRRLNQVQLYEKSKKVPLEGLTKDLEKKLEVFEHSGEKVAMKAHSWAGQEESELKEHIGRTKILLAELEVKCVSQMSELLQRWEEAKSVDEKKIKEAEQRTQEILDKCKEFQDARDSLCVTVLGEADSLAQERKIAAEKRARITHDIAQQQAATLQQQAAERRRQAEARLVEHRRHLEDVKIRCKKRVDAGIETANEKVHLATERFTEQLLLAERRDEEAQSSFEKAFAEYRAAFTRITGAAAEAERRGIAQIAGMLSQPSLQSASEVTGSLPPKPLWLSTTACDENAEMKETASTFFPDGGTTPLDFTSKSEVLDLR